MNIFLLAILCSTLAFTKIYLFFAFIYYKKYDTVPSYLLNLSYNSVYYYSKLQLGLIKTQNTVTSYVKSVPFLNNLLTYVNYKKCTFTEINDRLIICNKFNEEHNLDYKIIIRFKMKDWEYDYYECLQHKQADYKFIMTEITIDDKKFLIYFTTDKYNYLIVNNNIDKNFINYFLKTHYNDLVKDLEIENYSIRIVDHNVNIVEFDSSKTLIIKETEYVII
jgi:hypothetical protein